MTDIRPVYLVFLSGHLIKKEERPIKLLIKDIFYYKFDPEFFTYPLSVHLHEKVYVDRVTYVRVNKSVRK